MIDTQYENRMIYYNMMKDYLNKKITVLEFYKQYFDHDDPNREYSDPYFDILKIKFQNKALFETKDIHLLHDLEEIINASEFSAKYGKQKRKDRDENTIKGYYKTYEERMKNLKENEKIFKDKYSLLLYEEGSTVLPQYEQALKDFDIKGEIFFIDIQMFIEIYISEYTPSDAPYFNPNTDTDEETLRRRVQLAFDVLERHKDRWM